MSGLWTDSNVIRLLVAQGKGDHFFLLLSPIRITVNINQCLAALDRRGVKARFRDITTYISNEIDYYLYSNLSFSTASFCATTRKFQLCSFTRAILSEYFQEFFFVQVPLTALTENTSESWLGGHPGMHARFWKRVHVLSYYVRIRSSNDSCE